MIYYLQGMTYFSQVETGTSGQMSPSWPGQSVRGLVKSRRLVFSRSWKSLQQNVPLSIGKVELGQEPSSTCIIKNIQYYEGRKNIYQAKYYHVPRERLYYIPSMFFFKQVGFTSKSYFWVARPRLFRNYVDVFYYACNALCRTSWPS